MNDKLRKAAEILSSYRGRELRIMEVCGTHTHELSRQGIRSLLSEDIVLISGPGCPVCVTDVSYIDEAVWLALEKGCIICTFGDLIRVPGSDMSLADARSRGSDIQIVYAPADAVDIAQRHPDKQVVFLSVGFETTVPSSCIAVERAASEGRDNFTLLTANKTMPGAYRALMGSADAFLYPGHVSAITGTDVYEELKSMGVSGTVAGFTTAELITALAVTVNGLIKGEPFFVNCYPRVVRPEGSPAARRLIDKIMEPCDAVWRGLGSIPMSGLRLRDGYSAFDARTRHGIPAMEGRTDPACCCGNVLSGRCRPADCPLFGTICDPDHPVGACMVSDEGACSAYFMYERR